MRDADCIRHPLIERIGIAHGFGTRGSAAPPTALRPIQVHGAGVLYVKNVVDSSTANNSAKDVPRSNVEYVDPRAGGAEAEADAIVCGWPGQSIAIVTADCIPILACSESGNAVAAIHAGWRGLAKGVVEAGIEALREIASPGEGICSVIGPHIGGCCYEVDEPVLEAMTQRFGVEALARASHATGPGHARLFLAELVDSVLDRVGVAPELRGRLEQSCTCCEIERFHSFRREGRRAGRMVHFIATAQQ